MQQNLSDFMVPNQSPPPEEDLDGFEPIS